MILTMKALFSLTRINIPSCLFIYIITMHWAYNYAICRALCCVLGISLMIKQFSPSWGLSRCVSNRALSLIWKITKVYSEEPISKLTQKVECELLSFLEGREGERAKSFPVTGSVVSNSSVRNAQPIQPPLLIDKESPTPYPAHKLARWIDALLLLNCVSDRKPALLKG